MLLGLGGRACGRGSRRDLGVLGRFSGGVARPAWPAERTKCDLIGSEAGEVGEPLAVAPAVDRGIDSLRSQTVVAGDRQGACGCHTAGSSGLTFAVRPENAKNIAANATSANATGAL